MRYLKKTLIPFTCRPFQESEIRFLSLPSSSSLYATRDTETAFYRIFLLLSSPPFLHLLFLLLYSVYLTLFIPSSRDQRRDEI